MVPVGGHAQDTTKEGVGQVTQDGEGSLQGGRVQSHPDPGGAVELPSEEVHLSHYREAQAQEWRVRISQAVWLALAQRSK